LASNDLWIVVDPVLWGPMWMMIGRNLCQPVCQPVVLP